MTTPPLAEASDSTEFRIGSVPRRLEDHRFLRGEGRYLADIPIGNAAHAVVVRSEHAHGYLRAVDATSARAMPGVLAVLTATDCQAAGVGPIWPHSRVNEHTGEEFRYEPQPILATERVRYVGEPVALVVARSGPEAQAAAERVAVAVEPIPAVIDARAATGDDAPRLFAGVDRNTCLAWEHGSREGTDAAFAAAAHVVRLETHNHRIVHCPLEPRGAIGAYAAGTGTYVLTVSSQNVHVIREHVARSLGAAPDAVRVRAPDVGGGFGTRNFAYAEYVLVLWAARELGRPVRWVGSRSEAFVSDHQARDAHAHAELALDAEGRFLGLRVRSIFNAGAYLTGVGGRVPTHQYPTLPGGVYDIPAIHLDVRAVLTNTTPIGVTRGPGFAEALGVIERLVDQASHQHGFDRIELRRRNVATRMPWTNAVGNTVDSGDFRRCLARAAERADVSGFAVRRREAQVRGRHRGLGVVLHIKATGGAPDENVELAFPPGQVVLTTGTQAIGQGHETSFRQIVSTLLGLPPEVIEYRAGDTGLIATGGGHGSSRATYMAGTAISMAVEKVLAKGREVAARALQAAPDDVGFAAGTFSVAGTGRAIGLLETARLARDMGDPLDTYQHFVREAMTYPNGCHVAEVEIDPETGALAIVRYTACDDYGVLVNPMLAEGQVHGAIAQGIGQAWREQAVYAPDSGQPLTGSFMDYCLPRAGDLPSFGVHFEGVACTTNPLGVKGCGEAGAVAGYPAVVNAVLDALRPFGVSTFDGPATPLRIWQLIHRPRST
jgi:aerobic carbon-monoxide dehydrogenase large subunit